MLSCIEQEEVYDCSKPVALLYRRQSRIRTTVPGSDAERWSPRELTYGVALQGDADGAGPVLYQGRSGAGQSARHHPGGLHERALYSPGEPAAQDDLSTFASDWRNVAHCEGQDTAARYDDARLQCRAASLPIRGYVDYG